MIYQKYNIEELFEDKKSQKAKWKKVKASFYHDKKAIERDNAREKLRNNLGKTIEKNKKKLYGLDKEHPGLTPGSMQYNKTKGIVDKHKKHYKVLHDKDINVVSRRKKALDLLQQRAKKNGPGPDKETKKNLPSVIKKKKLSGKKKLAIGAGATLAAAGAIYSGKKIKEKADRKRKIRKYNQMMNNY
jgi:hypothetical protein